MPVSTHHKKSHQIIRSFEAQELKKRPLVVKIADFLSSGFGTITFLTANVIIYTVWILINNGKFPGISPVDPFPYAFMNSFVSIEAIILSIIVLMSQNRQNQRDTLRNELSLQVQLISEREITKILGLLKDIRANQKDAKADPELDEMTKEIDEGYIERKLAEQLDNPQNKVL
jgi:uncharacterized membrane protein